ncbi:methyl-accepting chemotaxis protein [Methylobacterium phyllosphaerae]
MFVRAPSIRFLLVSLFALIGLSSIGFAALEIFRSRSALNKADQVATYMSIDHGLFVGLTELRVERGWALFALAAEPDRNRSHRQASLAGRTAFDAVADTAISGLSQASAADLRAKGADLQTLLRAWRRARPAMDVAFEQRLAERDPTLRKSVDDLANRFITALEAASEVVETAIQTLDSGFGSYLDARAATWVARKSGGTVLALVGDFRTQVITSKPEALQRLITAQGEEGTAWQLAERSVKIAGVDADVKEAYARAKAAYFAGRLSEMRQAAIGELLAGRPLLSLDPDWDTRVLAGLKAISDAAVTVLDAAVKQARASAAAARQDFLFAVAAILFAAGLAAAAILIVQVHVVRGILGLAGSMRRLADGEVDAHVSGARRTDELGMMAGAVQVFKDNLVRTRSLEQEAAEARHAAEARRRTALEEIADGFEQAVGGIVHAVSGSAVALQATARSMASTAAETAAQSTTVAAAADQAATNVGTVAAAAEELGTSVQEIGRQVDGSAGLAQAAVAEADRSGELVHALTQSVGKIGEIVALISGIAAQTNLLALNATIEAARAGEAGKGFAVVAAEVKALADQTARATEEISRQVGQVQGASDQAASAIGAIAARIREINGVAASIAAAVEEQEAATQEIARNVGQAAAGTGEVTSNIASVASAAEETGTAAGQVLAAASALSDQSAQLTAEVQRFLATVRAA